MQEKMAEYRAQEARDRAVFVAQVRADKLQYGAEERQAKAVFVVGLEAQWMTAKAKDEADKAQARSDAKAEAWQKVLDRVVIRKPDESYGMWWSRCREFGIDTRGLGECDD